MIDIPNPIKSDWTLYQFQAAAHSLGYDPQKVSFKHNVRELLVDIPKSVSKLADSDAWVSPMAANIFNGEIYVFPSAVPSGEERSLLAHEIFHMCYYRTLEKLQEQVFAGGGPLLFRFEHTLPVVLLSHIEPITEYIGELSGLYRKGELTHDVMTSEVLSEMARIYERTGELVNTPLWRKLYKDVETTAIELGVIRR